MPQASNIVLADAQGTPVNHTFKPIGREGPNQVFVFTDSTAPNSIGQWRVTVDVRMAKTMAPDAVHRIKVTLSEPVMEVLGDANAAGYIAAPVVAYTPRSIHEFIVPVRATSLDRQNLMKMSPNLLANAQIKAVVENLEYLW